MAMRPAASMQQIVQGQTAPSSAPESDRRTRRVAAIEVDGPSRTFRTFEQREGLFEIEYPENWEIYESDQGYGVTIAATGGFVDTGGRERELIAGVIVNRYDSLEDDSDDRFGARHNLIEGDSDLIRATNALVSQILRLNPNMAMIDDSQRRNRIDGAPSVSVILSGRSPATREEERVTVFTREIPDEHVIYALFIAPEQDYDALNETFNRMISSLRVSDNATHSSNFGQDVGRDTGADSGRSRSARSGATVPSGTVLIVEFLQTLSSNGSRSGDRFTAQIVEPVLLDGAVAIAAGSTVSGRVVDVQQAKRFGGRAQLNLEFTTLRLASGSERPIAASFHGQADGPRDAVIIGGAAAGGAVLGRVLGEEDKDAVLGAILGGAIGTGIAARKRGEEVTVPEGVAIEIRLDAPFTI
jgi:outer membrane lipoprotein SlyB